VEIELAMVTVNCSDGGAATAAGGSVEAGIAGLAAGAHEVPHARTVSESRMGAGRRMFTLYTTPLSANGRKVLAVCKHLAIEPDVKLVNVYAGEGRAPAYLEIHPLGKIPTLVDGHLVVWESNAVLQYIVEAHGGNRLWSREAKGRAAIARWLYWETAEWQPALVQVLTGFVARELGLIDGRTPVTINWSESRFRTQADFLEGHLRGREFLALDELTIADLSVAAMMMYVRRAYFPFSEFPAIAAWYERIEALDAWRSTAVEPWTY
jgi:glutathione S-transferase